MRNFLIALFAGLSAAGATYLMDSLFPPGDSRWVIVIIVPMFAAWILVLTDPNRNRTSSGTQSAGQSSFSEALSGLGIVLLFYLFIPILMIALVATFKLFEWVSGL